MAVASPGEKREGLEVVNFDEVDRLAAGVENEMKRTDEESRRELDMVGQLEEQIDSFEEDREQLQGMCEEVDVVEADRENFRKLLDELCAEKEELKHVEGREEELTVPLQYEDSKQLALFEKCMGLQFKTTEDRALTLVFQYIDPSDIQRQFSITVDVDDEHSHWTVVGMDPQVHGVRPLLNELNRSGNFTQFCKAIRNTFKEQITPTLPQTP